MSAGMVQNIKVIECQPFLKVILDIIQDKFHKRDNQIRILEVGCGAGDFSLILKDTLQDKADITAIDPSFEKIEEAKAKSSAIYFENSDIYNFKSNHTYDLVMFTKSLHHCDPIDKAVQLASNLLANRGVFIAEEISGVEADHASMTWFFDRLDLFSAAGLCLSSADPSKKTLNRLLDTSLLPVERRWIRQKDASPRKGITAPQDVCSAIDKQFGKENVHIVNAPFFHVMIVYAGLKNNEAGEAVLRKFMEQEERDIKEGIIASYGMNIIATKL